jgi:hypothetical protein
MERGLSQTTFFYDLLVEEDLFNGKLINACSYGFPGLCSKQ